MAFRNDRVWLTERIAAVEALIVKFEEAIGAVVGGAQSYSLDTGQTRQSVTKANLAEIQRALAELEAKRDAYYLRRDGGSFIARPNT
jgi:hypothetical protein